MTVGFDGPTQHSQKVAGTVVMIAIDRDGYEHGPWQFRITDEAREKGATVEGLKALIDRYMTTGE